MGSPSWRRRGGYAVGRSARFPRCAGRPPLLRREHCIFSVAPMSSRCLGDAIPCWYCRYGGGSIDPLPTALMASPSVLLGLAVWMALASGRADVAGYTGLGAEEGEGGGTRLVLIPCRCARIASVRSKLVRAMMPFKCSIVAALNQSRNRVPPAGSSHGTGFCVHHMPHKYQRQEQGKRQHMD